MTIDKPLFTSEADPDPNNDKQRRPDAGQVSFSPDGTRVLAAYSNGTADLWET